MEDSIPDEYLSLLKAFVDWCKVCPSRLNDPSLKFFKDFLLSFGATIPESKLGTEEQRAQQPSPKDERMSESAGSDLHSESSVESDESEVELDNSGVIEPDNDEPLPLGNESIVVTEEMLEDSSVKRMEAVRALNEGNKEEAIKLLTSSIMANPHSAIGYAKRAGVLLSINKPNAVIRDCNKALSLNPDQALAYKYRGRANRLLGKWEEAANDLALACKLDYSDEANEWLKEITPNVKKLQDHRRKCERKQREKEQKERYARYERAKAAHETRASEEGSDNTASFPGFGSAFPPDMQEFLKDPEVSELLQDPEVAALLAEVNKPGGLENFYANPKIAKIMSKIKAKLGEHGD